MLIYLTGSGGRKDYLAEQRWLNPPRLFSYYLLITKNITYGEMDRFKDLLTLKEEMEMDRQNIFLFLDSGAYSAYTQAVVITLSEYIQFIKANLRWLTRYSGLDVLGNPEATYQNQLAMEKAGLHPDPCFHYGEDEKYLKKYVSGKYEHISLGGMVIVKDKRMLRAWLDRIFRDYICGPDGMPKVKVHGFGMTVHKLMWRYPWWSVDSSSWVLFGRNGGVYIPQSTGVAGVYDYKAKPYRLYITEGSKMSKQITGSHFNSLSDYEKKKVREYVKFMGQEFGESKLKEGPLENGAFPPDYQTQEGERWRNEEEGLVEDVIVDGASTKYQVRDVLNVQYYMDLTKAINQQQPYPWAFTVAPKGFGMAATRR